MALQDDLLPIQHELWTGGADAYRRNLDRDCLIAFTEMAGLSSREEVAGMAEGAERWRDVQTEVEGLLQPTDDVAVLTYRVSAVRRDADRYLALISSAYVRRDGDWKMVFHQQTPLPG